MKSNIEKLAQNCKLHPGETFGWFFSSTMTLLIALLLLWAAWFFEYNYFCRQPEGYSESITVVMGRQDFRLPQNFIVIGSDIEMKKVQDRASIDLGHLSKEAFFALLDEAKEVEVFVAVPETGLESVSVEATALFGLAGKKMKASFQQFRKPDRNLLVAGNVWFEKNTLNIKWVPWNQAARFYFIGLLIGGITAGFVILIYNKFYETFSLHVINPFTRDPSLETFITP